MRMIKFEKQGCVPCQRVQNHLDGHGVEVEKINPFDEPEAAIRFEIGSVPVTILLDDNDEEIQRSIGFNEDELEEMIAKLNQ